MPLDMLFILMSCAWCSASTLAALSKDLEICKQMFAYGAIKPLLNVSDADVTNEACMLAGLGCLVQMCKYVITKSSVDSRLLSLCIFLYATLRIPQIGVRVVRQGALPVLEKGLHRKKGLSIRAVSRRRHHGLNLLTFLLSNVN